MDTTHTVGDSHETGQDPIDRVHAILRHVTDVDPAEAVEPLAEVADLLETMLEEGDEA